jgi:uroporphyrinogen decarboxylase
MIPTVNPPESNAWRDGVDEWGRVWRRGTYVGGVVDTVADLKRYSPDLGYVEWLWDAEQVLETKVLAPDHCLFFGTHIGPFTAGFMAMGFESFFTRLVENPRYVHRLLELRTEWCVAMYRKAVSLGAELLVLGDDAGQASGPMVSPAMWREHIWPYHVHIVDALDAPVVWHSDGNVETLLPMAVEAGFSGFHGMDPGAGMNLARIRTEYGRDLVLVGNVDTRVLCGSNLDAVRSEVDRCLEQGGQGGGYMMATCNSIFEDMNPAAVAELFRYEELVVGGNHERGIVNEDHE